MEPRSQTSDDQLKMRVKVGTTTMSTRVASKKPGTGNRQPPGGVLGSQQQRGGRQGGGGGTKRWSTFSHQPLVESQLFDSNICMEGGVKKKSNEFSCPRNFGFSFSCWRNETTFWPVNWSVLKDAKVAANLHR